MSQHPECRYQRPVPIIMGQLRISSNQVENLTNQQEGFSPGQRVNRFYFDRISEYWQRKLTDECVVQTVTHVNQLDSRYLLKSFNKYQLYINRQIKYAFKQLEVIQKQKSDSTFDLLFAFQDKYNLYMVMKYEQGHTLEDILKVHVFNENEAKFVVCSLIKALETFHERGYAAVSLDPHTIIFDPKEQIIRIIDLPELNRLGESVEFRALGKSQTYSSPESVEGLPSQMESDYYSLGVVMYQIMTRKKPIYFKTTDRQKQEFLEHQIQISKSEIPIGWTPSAVDFLVQLLTKSPQYRLGRYGPTEVREQPWIQSYDWNILSDRHRKKISLEFDRIQRSPWRPISYNKSLPQYNNPVFQSQFQKFSYRSV